MKTLVRCIVGLIVAVAVAGVPSAHSAPTGPPQNPTGIDPATYLGLEFVPIGQPFNNPDYTGYGSVPYAYEIGEYAVTEDQWSRFVSTAGSPFGVPSFAYDRTFSWADDVGFYEPMPVVAVSWYEVAQFCNWLTSGDKFAGAYQFNSAGVLTGVDRDVARDMYGTVCVIPSEDEWYKAAYFKPDGSGYSLYAHGLDTEPLAGIDAIFTGTYPPDFEFIGIGSCQPEQNGTYDMMGLVFEWTESAWDGVLDTMSENRSARGGILDEGPDYMRSTFRSSSAPEDEWDGIGFRVVRLSDPYIAIEIDIKPGSDVNPIHLNSKGRVPVAILSSEQFDASSVNIESVRFAGAAPVKHALDDVDGDGDVDLKLHFMTADLVIDPADWEVMLMGQTYDGMLIVGMDTVKVISRPTR